MSSDIAERTRRRQWSALVAIAVGLACLGAVVPGALSRAIARPTLQASSNFVVFNQHVALTGTSPTEKVTLLARHFGESAYSPVATARVHHGAFQFSPVPNLATSYKVSAGTQSVTVSNPVQVYVHLEVVQFICNLCKKRVATTHTQLHYTVVVGVPAADMDFVKSEPVYLYVGSSPGKVQSERRVASATPVQSGPTRIRVSGTLKVNLPAGFKLRFNACDRSEEPKTGVGLPSVHDCGSPSLSHDQFSRYVG